MVIFAWTSGNTVYFKIYRCQFDTDEYDEIRLTSEKLETIYPSGEMEEELDPSLAPGEEEIVVNRRNGERWQSYKNYYKDGKLVRSEKLAVSTYSAFAGKKLVGPSPSPSASVTPSAPATPGPPAPVRQVRRRRRARKRRAAAALRPGDEQRMHDPARAHA